VICREQSPQDIVSLHLGGTTQNIGKFLSSTHPHISLPSLCHISIVYFRMLANCNSVSHPGLVRRSDASFQFLINMLM
jgi:hypothetical protein